MLTMQIDSKGFKNPTTGGIEDSRYNAAVFVQNLSEFESNDLLIGLRSDKNEAYGTNTTGNIAWGFDLPKSMRLVASYGTGFRAPTFNDLYYPGGSGNPDLKPESSENYELELSGNHAIGKWSIAAFQNNIEDMIDWDKKPY